MLGAGGTRYNGEDGKRLSYLSPLDMAVASGRAGRVLARPLFRRTNLQKCSLNTRHGSRKDLVSRAVSENGRPMLYKFHGQKAVSHFDLFYGHS